MSRALKKILGLLLSLAIVLSALMSVSVFAEIGDVTGGEERLDAYGHSLVLRSEVSATCKNQGYKIFYCETCNQEYFFDYTPMVDHTPSDWIIDVNPTQQAAGHKYIECTVCKTVLSEEVIPQLTSEHLAGDINRDGKVNNKDLTRLFQYLSDWEVEVDEAVLDVNGDGKINNKDLTRLFQYLSDWDVVIYGAPENTGDQGGTGGKIDGNGTIYLPEVP